MSRSTGSGQVGSPADGSAGSAQEDRLVKLTECTTLHWIRLTIHHPPRANFLCDLRGKILSVSISEIRG